MLFRVGGPHRPTRHGQLGASRQAIRDYDVAVAPDAGRAHVVAMAAQENLVQTPFLRARRVVAPTAR